MKKFLALLIGVVLATLWVGTAFAGEKVTVCHVPPGNPANAHTINIAEEAWNAGHSPHQSHVLDYLGECVPAPTPVPTDVPPEPTPRPTDPRPEPTPVPTEPSTPQPVPSVCPLPDAPAVEACDTCGTLERIADSLERIAIALEEANDG